MKNIVDKKIVIITHEATTGPAHDLRDYILHNKAKQLIFIAHPLLYIPENYRNVSYWQQYEKGIQVKSGKSGFLIRLPELLMYVKDCFYSIFWTMRLINHADWYIGVGNINAAMGILLRKMGIVKRVVYYTIDYVPHRFSVHLINEFYHGVEKFAVGHSDVVWNLSPRMEEGRKKKWGKSIGNQVTVPIGIWYDRISKNRSKQKNHYELIYLGTLLEKQGIDICIRVVAKIKNKIPKIRFTIIGNGPYKDTLLSLVAKLKLQKYVKFLGYIPDHADVEKRISEGSLAVALYNPKKDIFSYYADPGKVKSYLACGLPMLITDIPWIAQLVEKEKCGKIVSYNEQEISKAVVDLFSNPKKMKTYQQNAINLARSYDWNAIFLKAFKTIS
jgi:glycosyltransferase involved in cell wall biosynthesis